MAKRTKSLIPSEKQIHTNVCEYLRINYPDLIFTSDPSGIKSSMGVVMDVQRKVSKHKIPDLLIFEPNSQYSAAFFEIKRSVGDLYLKSGKLKNDHVKAQQQTIDLLLSKGYFATFTIGFEGTIQTIEKYLNT